MEYLRDQCLGQDTQCTGFEVFEANLKKGDSRMIAALEMILPGNPAEAAFRLDTIRMLRSLEAHPST